MWKVEGGNSLTLVLIELMTDMCVCFLAINVFFGIGLGRSAAFTPSWVLWVLVGFVVFHGLTQIILEVHRCYLQQKDKGKRDISLIGSDLSSLTYQVLFPPPRRYHFYPTALKGCRGIVFTHGVLMFVWPVSRKL